MTKFAFSCIVACGVALASPASAQITISGAGQSGDSGLSRQLEQTLDRLRQARREQRLSREEARAFRREARGIRSLKARYARGGLSDAEIAELRFRVSALDGLAQAPLPPRQGGAGGR